MAAEGGLTVSQIGPHPQQQTGDKAGRQARPSAQNQPLVARKEVAMRSDRKNAPMVRWV
jgi:hypothetical protein